MGTRFYNLAVVMFWLATMSWLLVDKLWPTLRVGDPPSYHAILKADQGESANLWAIYWNDRLTGWSMGKLVTQQNGMRELHSRIFIAKLPLDQLVPHWLGTVIKPVLTRAGQLDMDMRNRLDIDPLGRVAGFDSVMRLADIPDTVRVYGTVEGDELKLHTPSGQLSSAINLARGAMVGDGISPQGYLPNLYMGQTWTVFAYSMFHPSSDPLIQARVEQFESIFWDGKPVRAWLVVYRGDTGTGLMNDLRAKVWVREDGMVLQQELTLFGSRLRFDRLSPERGCEISEIIDPYAKEDLPASVGKELLQLIR
jgi:hypothetical protein